MRLFKNFSNKGLSLVEILTATLILMIVSGASYATFVAITKMTTTVRNTIEGYQLASKWLEDVRTGVASTSRYNNMAQTAAPVNLNDPASILREDYAQWPLATKPNVEDLTATYTVVDMPPTPSGLVFKKVTVTVSWKRQ